MGRIVSLQLEFKVDDSITEEQIADKVNAALKPLAPQVNDIGNVIVRTVPRSSTAVGRPDPPPYDGRIFDKATC